MTPVKVRGRRHPKRRTVSAPSTSAADDNSGGVLDMTDDREFADALRERERLNEIERLGEEAGRERDARSTSALSRRWRTPTSRLSAARWSPSKRSAAPPSSCPRRNIAKCGSSARAWKRSSERPRGLRRMTMRRDASLDDRQSDRVGNALVANLGKTARFLDHCSASENASRRSVNRPEAAQASALAAVKKAIAKWCRPFSSRLGRVLWWFNRSVVAVSVNPSQPPCVPA